ncbi:type II toxin-antitoxin system VapC family toxin [Ottowia sp.]|jgi:predicted nucleic acid-binding protein|uniref:type II toxin-antitoxin system VapC family toxin n=1 Tax=Ottowia sp. TaxID=1898956 RepID=UPI0025F83855|nr:type II toxin-antitoxin system VapC family toxin [Ottowia sp.]MBK6613424.1 type II toxin-antitoxin system VapC family toxin [Ottowia sp.]MBK6747469.1 type II toxin-antitoxin system VapC family toxin [Ottowia sp.]
MIYVDTSVIVALIVNETGSAGVAAWYAATRSELVSAAWCVTEFASVLGLKQRTAQIDAAQARAAWGRFERLASNDLRLLSVEPVDFHRAAQWTMDAASGVRAGDALHLACAERAATKSIATLDVAMARHARRLKIKPMAL